MTLWGAKPVDAAAPARVQSALDVIPQATVAIGALPQHGLNTLGATAPQGAFLHIAPLPTSGVGERIFGTLPRCYPISLGASANGLIP